MGLKKGMNSLTRVQVVLSELVAAGETGCYLLVFRYDHCEMLEGAAGCVVENVAPTHNYGCRSSGRWYV